MLVNKKDRRHSGRKYTKIYNPKDEPYEEEVWDDWNDWRDGMRYNPDRTQFRNRNAYLNRDGEIDRYNEKLKRKEQIRKKRKGVPNR